MMKAISMNTMQVLVIDPAPPMAQAAEAYNELRQGRHIRTIVSSIPENGNLPTPSAI